MFQMQLLSSANCLAIEPLGQSMRVVESTYWHIVGITLLKFVQNAAFPESYMLERRTGVEESVTALQTCAKCEQLMRSQLDQRTKVEQTATVLFDKHTFKSDTRLNHIRNIGVALTSQEFPCFPSVRNGKRFQSAFLIKLVCFSVKREN